MVWKLQANVPAPRLVSGLHRLAGATRQWKDVFISHPCSKRQRTFAFILMHNQKDGNIPVHMYVYVLLKYLMDSCLTKTKLHHSCQGKKGASGSAEIFDQQERRQRAHLGYRTAQG